MVQGGLCRPYTCQLCDRESRLACLIIRRRSRVCHSRFITRVVGLINAWDILGVSEIRWTGQRRIATRGNTVL